MKVKELIDNPMFLMPLGEFMSGVMQAHYKAIEKHPMSSMFGCNGLAGNEKQDLQNLQGNNDHREKLRKFNCYDLLDEEVSEAYIEICDKNWNSAQMELVQVAQVAFRLWLWCEQMKAAEVKKHPADLSEKRDHNEDELENY